MAPADPAGAISLTADPEKDASEEGVALALSGGGYVVFDAALRRHVDCGLGPPKGFPFPTQGVCAGKLGG